MTADAVLVVRYGAAGRATAEQTIRRLLCKQGIWLLVLATLIALLFVVLPFAGLAVAGAAPINAAFIFLMIALLVVPIAIGVLGVRHLRRQWDASEVAVTITPDTVRFPAIERVMGPGLMARAEEWGRDGTSARLIPASGLQPARVEFSRQDGAKRRRRSVAADNLDVAARVIVEALNGSNAS